MPKLFLLLITGVAVASLVLLFRDFYQCEQAGVTYVRAPFRYVCLDVPTLITKEINP